MVYGAPMGEIWNIPSFQKAAWNIRDFAEPGFGNSAVRGQSNCQACAVNCSKND
jgi:hypothetical protein